MQQCWNGVGWLSINSTSQKVVMTARIIMMTVQMTKYEQKDNCEPDGLSPQSDELTINTLGVRIINPLNTISF
jgi:hypothetical protein